MRKRRILSLVMTAVLAVGMGVISHAEGYTGDGSWKVEFTGKRMESNFTSSDISDAVYALQPGDSIDVHIALANAADLDTDWYMTNEILASLEDSQSVASGGAYSYILTYTDETGGVTTLYSSETVGGDNGGTPAGQGLHEVSDSLEEYFYLDSLKPGQKGDITLQVALDGETQGNGYQNTLAKLQMNFAVEENNTGGTPTQPTTPSETPGTSTPTGPTPGGGTHKTGTTFTGDPNNLFLWSALMLLAGLLLAGCGVFRLKRSERRA